MPLDPGFVGRTYPPTPPYDIAGWTLAYQMAVQFDRVLDGFDGPLEEIKGPLPPPRGHVDDVKGAVGFFLGTQTNDSFRAVNRRVSIGVKKPDRLSAS